MPACRVQIPSLLAKLRPARKATSVPTPFPRARAATYTLTSCYSRVHLAAGDAAEGGPAHYLWGLSGDKSARRQMVGVPADPSRERRSRRWRCRSRSPPKRWREHVGQSAAIIGSMVTVWPWSSMPMIIGADAAGSRLAICASCYIDQFLASSSRKHAGALDESCSHS